MSFGMGDLSIPLGGMAQAESRLNTVASRLARLAVPASAPGDTVDLSAEMVALTESKNAYEANVKAAQTFEQMSRTVLDILA